MRIAPLTLLLTGALIGCPKTTRPAPPEGGSGSVGIPISVTAVGKAFGGVFEVEVRCPSEAEREDCMGGALAAKAEIERLEQVTDTWNTDGDVARINAAAGKQSVEIGDDTYRMLTAAQVVAAASGGAFDVTIGSISGSWGIPGAALPDAEVLRERLGLVDWQKLEVVPGFAALTTADTSIVLGGVVKGDAADSALEAIPRAYEARVDMAGDVAVRGAWTLTVDVPGDPQRNVSVQVRNTVLVSSGTYTQNMEVGGGHYARVLDPRTGEMASGANVSLVAHSQGAIADALATTLRITGEKTQAVDQLGAWALLFTDQGPVEMGARGNAVIGWDATPSDGSGSD